MLLLALLALAAAWAPTGDPDAWWHFATGRAILATHSTLPTDPWSSLHRGQPWAYKDLIADVLLYGAFRGGFVGLLALKAVVGFLLGVAIFAAARGRIWIAAALAATLLAAVPLSERPSLFSMACFAGVWVLGDRGKHAAAGSVAWLWVSLHRAFPLGFALLFAQALAKRTRASILVAVVVPVAGLINPSGLAAYRTAFAAAGSPEIRRMMSNWSGLGPSELLRAMPILAALVVLAIVAAAVALYRRRAAADARDLAVTLALAAAIASAAQFVPYLALAAALTLARLAGESDPMPRAQQLAAALATLLLLVGRPAPFRLGEGRATPVAAVDFARAHHLAGPVANSFELGGYLLWALPEASPLSDGRNEVLYPPAFVERAIRSERDPAEFAAFRAQDHATWTLSSQRIGAHAFLRGDNRWLLAYADDAAAIWALKEAHPELEAESYRWLDPADVPGSVVRAIRAGAASAVAAELRRLEPLAPARATLGMRAYSDAIR
jgi:hypothetical protein